MNERDYFAGQAITYAWHASGSTTDRDMNAMFGNRVNITREEIVAALAYRLADEMMKQRERGDYRD